MRITKRQLRRIIREAADNLEYYDPEQDGIDATEAASSAREDIHRAVQAAIAKYSSGRGQFQWRQAQNDFEMQADGEFFPGITDVYYAGWTPEDFQAVIDGVEG